MVQLFTKRKNGQAATEYIGIIVLILAAFLIFQQYISRGFFGRWKGVGDQIGFGHQYDPRNTADCAYSKEFDVWYDDRCFQETCGIDDCIRETTRDLTPGGSCDICVTQTCQEDICE